ncbi:MAG: hypothetical protein A2W93_06155 [Bacteroidetes bacterium GWF2_43_63]|nr:MAG: hypothetical protein A2W94_06745 [Bacteroidetes bacterium GWE2_42_42]OFY56200.1 MAG: hypothetical protein A2W93_06155 [Bacteroidetes bacterium GWF2_43_63]HBG70564.1 hypothetical protein [Bacteroidales bacterium]HCB61987.1 hypothetical protein [Bacteroidales bacterium]HCY22742.1 hypothetical protein [Bacteroidales bacterium]
MKQISFFLLVFMSWQLQAQGPFTPPYSTDFNSYTTEDEFLADWSYQNNLPTDQAGVWGFDNTAYFGYNSSNCPFYFTASTSGGNDWLFSPGFTLMQGANYSLSFLYAGALDGYTEKMKVYIGNADTSVAMTQMLHDFTDIASADFQMLSVSFTVPANGTYFFGFQALSAAGNFGILIDNFSVDNGTGIYNNQVSENVFYPNPCIGILHVSADEPQDISIFSTDGKVVFQTTANGSADLTNLPDGPYFMQINNKETQLLIIQKY